MLTTEEWIQKAKKKHNNKYDYSKVKYINSKEKVCIICPIHGEFWQRAANHLRPTGCPKCIVKGTLSTGEDWIYRSSKVHNNKYDYSKVEYINSKTKVCIICPIHGEFWQQPNNHLNSISGCPICKESKGEKLIRDWLEENKIEYSQEYKFKDCKNKFPLPFDFYLPEYNICIEFDGVQHYKPFSFLSRKTEDNIQNENLKKLKQRDSIKTEYCLKNGIKLIRIPYFKIRYIEEILIEKMEKNYATREF